MFLKDKSHSLLNTLYWRISASLLVLLLIIGLAYVIITAYAAKQYFNETNQRLNSHVAEHMLKEVTPFVNGKVNEEALGKIMHSMMAVNPSLEVYLLANDGKILSYVVLDKKVKLNYVDLAPIKEFIQNEGKTLVLGDDPKNPKLSKVFSATAVEENGIQMGYVYMVLVSEEYENVTGALWNSYLLTISTQFFVFTLLATFAIGLLVLWLLTKNLRIVIQTVRRFEQGDLQARIPVKSKGELAQLSRTFNGMADTILKNIEDLKQIDNLRRELIANVSHDLRTPLSVIHGYIETLLIKNDTLEDEDRKHYLNIILKSTERLKRLVADLFELSKLEARQIQPQKEAFFISELLQDATSKYKLMANNKGIEIKTEQVNHNPMVYADLAMIERVIQNLLDNAITHTPENGEISISVVNHQKSIEVNITNSGKGIPEQDIPHIFDRFYKVKKHDTSAKGTGLGLAIVKNIIDIHQSVINVKSKVNQYTTFAFNLPVFTNPTT